MSFNRRLIWLLGFFGQDVQFKPILCRLMGHRWGWPDILTCIQPEGLRFLPQWRECQRCGLREQDEKHEARILILPAFQGDPNACAFDNFGQKVKRAMGWDQ